MDQLIHNQGYEPLVWKVKGLSRQFRIEEVCRSPSQRLFEDGVKGDASQFRSIAMGGAAGRRRCTAGYYAALMLDGGSPSRFPMACCRIFRSAKRLMTGERGS
jgi:hypothetical protein